MSICTKTGDSGTTGLMYNRRVSKTDDRVEACGTLDELNAAIGMARATGSDPFIRESLLKVQRDLIILMGEVATLPEDLGRYEKDGFQIVSEELFLPIEAWIRQVESKKISFKGWATPGATLPAAALDMARAICRRAERRVQGLIEKGVIKNQNLLIYLNRLSDCLWLFARLMEAEAKD